MNSNRTDPRTALIYRSVGLLAGVFILLFPLLTPLPGDPGPMWVRWYLFSFIVISTTLSSTLEWFRNREYYTVYIVGFQITYWLVYLTMVNDFHPVYSGSLLICELFCAFIFRNYKWVIAFFGSSFTLSLFLYALPTGPSVHLIYFYLIELGILVLMIMVLDRLFTDRKKLVLKTEQFRTLAVAAFEYSDDGILVTDQKGVILQYNPRFLEMWDLTPEMMNSDEARAGYQERRDRIVDPDEFDRIYLESKEKPNKYIFQAFQFKDGRHMERFSRPLYFGDKHLGRIWFFKDVTEIKLKNQALELEKMLLEKQNEALAVFAASEAVQEGLLEEALPAIARSGFDILKVDRASAWLRDKNSDIFQCLFYHGHSDSPLLNSLEIRGSEHPKFLEAIEGLRVLGVTDIQNDDRFSSLKSISEGFTNRACILIPLRDKGQIRGIITFQAHDTVRNWTSNELGFAASISDVATTVLEASQRREAEIKLADSVAILTSVFEMSGVGIVITRNEGSVIDYNADFVNMWDLQPKHLEPGSEAIMMSHIQNQYTGNKDIKEAVSYLFENPDQSRVDRLYLKDGRLVERTTRGLWVNGEVRGRIWYYLDITRRVKAREALRRSERRNRAIVNAVPDLMLLLKPNGEIIDRTIPNSSSLAYLLQSNPQYIDGIFPEKIKLEIIEAMGRSSSGKDPIELELQMELEGELHDFEIRMVYSGEEEILTIFRDVTFRKTTERELIQRNFELDSFVYRASHDLKAPLNSLMGIIDILVQEDISSEIVTYIGLMNRSVVKLDTFIRNLTDFSRITRLEIKDQVVDFQQLFDETRESLMHMEYADRVELTLEHKDSLPWHGDRFHLGIVLANLLSNAIKYQDHQKEESRVLVRVEIKDNSTKIEVEDNGIGIKEEYQAQLFELFFRASNQSFGSGLGLYITKNAVEKMDGTVTLNSTPGVGTCFTVTVPNHTQEEQFN